MKTNLSIKELDVVIEGDAGGLDLTGDQLKTEIEQKLRDSGIDLVNTSKTNPASNTSALRLNIHVSKDTELVVYNAILRFHEVMSLHRSRESLNQSRRLGDTAIWNRGSIEYSRLSQDPKRKIHDTAKELADQFIEDFLVANSKESP